MHQSIKVAAEHDIKKEEKDTGQAWQIKPVSKKITKRKCGNKA